ncbi:MAG TPA: hypothetical protein VNE22_00120 [Acidimicrobiales bacterium]|nr:hypothetical protein [Acidimicrobiales bacterium]
MSVRRATLIAAAVLYLLLWAIALSGATSLIEPLVIPLVLALMVACGVWLNRFLGLSPRRQHFQDRDDQSES